MMSSASAPGGENPGPVCRCQPCGGANDEFQQAAGAVIDHEDHVAAATSIAAVWASGGLNFSR